MGKSVIEKSDFGWFKDDLVSLFSLRNRNGLVVKIMDYGATITSISIPDQLGEAQEIACGFDNFSGYFSEEYQANAPYFGGTVGRYTSQIKDAQFVLNGVRYQLAKNCGPNNLHGGAVGFDKSMWNAEVIENSDHPKLQMDLLSKHMDEGFPGNLSTRVIFSLNDENALQIDYMATTDRDTPFSITNHTYFNLSGFASSIEGHKVTIKANRRQIWDDTGAATGENISVNGAPDDLRVARKIGDVHNQMNDGFEHYYLFDEKGFALGKVAEISCGESGLTLEVITSEPGMLFYTGKYTSDKLKRESGQKYGKFRAFCCETHRYPNGPNIDAPKSILRAGETFKSTTIFKFK